MKLVIQRVKNAEVKIQLETVGKIGCGLLVFLGVYQTDTINTAKRYVKKLVNLRVFEDEAGKMNQSVKDIDGEILIVSQFTLYGDCSKGCRPSFIQAAQPEIAIPVYDKFVDEVKMEMGRVQTGRFGASMDVSLVNHGPVTLILENINN